MITNQDNNTCLYNNGVVCSTENRDGNPAHGCCETCGWNPKVAKERLDKILSASRERKNLTK